LIIGFLAGKPLRGLRYKHYNFVGGIYYMLDYSEEEKGMPYRSCWDIARIFILQ
jgi:hypothetical protein